MKKQIGTNTILYTIVLSQFFLPFMTSGIGITLPLMGKEMQASGVALGMVEMVFLGASCALVLPFGKVADMMNKEAIFKTGLVTTFIITLLLGFTTDIHSFIFLRLLQGICCSMIIATNMAILSDNIPKNQLGKAFGLTLGSVYAGLSLGPFIAGLITEHLGWRWIYFLSSLAILITYFFSAWFFRGKWQKPADRFDWKGSAVVIVMLFLWIAGSSSLDSGIIGIVLILAGFLLIPLFIILEKRTSVPLLELSLVRTNKRFTRALGVQLLVYAGAFANVFLFSLYLQSIRQYSPQQAGIILAISPVVMAITTPMFGRLSDRINPKTLAGSGAVFTVIGTMVATQVHQTSSIFLVYGALMIQGIGLAMFSSPNMKIIMTSIDKKRSSIASALAAEMRSLGMIISMVIVTLYLSAILGKTQISLESAGGFLSVMNYSLVTLSVIGIFAVVLSFRSDRPSIAPQS